MASTHKNSGRWLWACFMVLATSTRVLFSFPFSCPSWHKFRDLFKKSFYFCDTFDFSSQKQTILNFQKSSLKHKKYPAPYKDPTGIGAYTFPSTKSPGWQPLCCFLQARKLSLCCLPKTHKLHIFFFFHFLPH